jgi:hypothetical protein
MDKFWYLRTVARLISSLEYPGISSLSTWKYKRKKLACPGQRYRNIIPLLYDDSIVILYGFLLVLYWNLMYQRLDTLEGKSIASMLLLYAVLLRLTMPEDSSEISCVRSDSLTIIREWEIILIEQIWRFSWICHWLNGCEASIGP